MDKVSVVIPTYNRQHTLLRAVKSVLKQSYHAHEIIICDDGSTDQSKEIILQLNNTTIKWLDCGRNGMPAVPRNKGIQMATGNWVAFLDSDDEWLPNKLEVQLNYMKQNKFQASSTNAFRIINNINQGPYFSSENKTISFTELLALNYHICSSVMVSLNTLKETSLFPEEVD